jgi:hypothetical protein
VRALLESLQPPYVDVKGGSGGLTALMHAARGGHREVAELLLDWGADVHKRADKNGRTALIIAALHGRCEVVDLLLARGADARAKEAQGWTALTCAAGNGHQGVVDVLLAQDPDVSAHNSEGVLKRKRCLLRVSGQPDRLKPLWYIDRGDGAYRGACRLPSTRLKRALTPSAFVSRSLPSALVQPSHSRPTTSSPWR